MVRMIRSNEEQSATWVILASLRFELNGVMARYMPVIGGGGSDDDDDDDDTWGVVLMMMMMMTGGSGSTG